MNRSIFWYFMVLVMLVVLLPSCKNKHSNVKHSTVSTQQKTIPRGTYHPQLNPVEIYCKPRKKGQTCYYLRGDNVYKMLSSGKLIPATKISANRIRDTRRSGFASQGFNYSLEVPGLPELQWPD